MNYGIVLAAGKGTRMKTEMPKCAFPLLKKPMIEYVVDALKKAKLDSTICVIGHKKEIFEELLKDKVSYAIQEEQLGTAHAVLMTKEFVKEDGYSVIVPGDKPLIDDEMINDLIKAHLKNGNDLTVGVHYVDNPKGFGRILRDENLNVVRVIEDRDASAAEKKIREVNSGIYCVNNKLLFEAISQTSNENARHEYYLSDIVRILASNHKVDTYTFDDSFKLNGINDLPTLAMFEEDLKREINLKHMMNGVYLMNPDTIVISPDAKIGSGTTIYPGCMIMGNTKIGKNCVVGPYTETMNAVFEDNVTCKQSVVYDSKILSGATVGPFTHLRMNSTVGVNDRIGNFVEMKNSTLGEKTNVAHLTYIGDTTCGSHVNWGCGTVTVNYDGKNKHKTIIGDNVFIGCNTNLIAPIKVANDSFIAAGSTVTYNIEQGEFVIARTRQEAKRGYADKYKKK